MEGILEDRGSLVAGSEVALPFLRITAIIVHSYQSINERGLSFLIHAFLIKTIHNILEFMGLIQNQCYLQHIFRYTELHVTAMKM